MQHSQSRYAHQTPGSIDRLPHPTIERFDHQTHSKQIPVKRFFEKFREISKVFKICNNRKVLPVTFSEIFEQYSKVLKKKSTFRKIFKISKINQNFSKKIQNSKKSNILADGAPNFSVEGAEIVEKQCFGPFWSKTTKLATLGATSSF